MRNSWFYKIFASPYFVFIEIVLLALIGISLGKEFIRRSAVSKEIGKLKQELGDLENENKKIQRMIELANSKSFFEEEARQRLGLAKPGEKALVLVGERNNMPQTGQTGDLGVILEETKKEQEKYQNLKNWWNYFFGY